MNVYHFSTDPLFCQNFGCGNGFPNKMAAGKKAYVGSFGQNLCFSNYKISAVFGGEIGPFGAAKTQVNRSMVIGNGFGCRFGLVKIAGVNHCHARQHFHETKVFEYLMGSTIFTKGKTGVACTNFYIFIAIGNALPDLIINAPRAEVGKGGGVGNFASNG